MSSLVMYQSEVNVNRFCNYAVCPGKNDICQKATIQVSEIFSKEKIYPF